MFLEGDELKTLLAEENRYIDSIKERWGVNDLPKKTERDLRMGKRTELLGDLQKRKEEGKR